MNKKLNAFVIVLYISLSLIIITAGLFSLNALPGIGPELLENVFAENMQPEDNDSIIENLHEYTTPDDESDKISVDMLGVWLDLNDDLTVSPQAAVNDIQYEIYSDFDYYKNFTANTVYIKPDVKNNFSVVKNTDGSDFDILAYTLALAESNKYVKVLVADDALVFNDSGEVYFDKIRNYLKSYKFDALLLSSDALLADTAKLNETVKNFSQKLKNQFPEISFGCEFHSNATYRYADENILGILNSSSINFAYIEAGGAIKSAELPFAEVMRWWNDVAKYYPDTAFYCEHRNDLILSYTSDWSNYTEIAEQMKILWDCENIDGSSFYKTRSLKNRRSASQRLSYLIYEGAGNKDFTVNQFFVDAAGQHVTVSGLAMENHKVICNGTVIDEDGGDFSAQLALSPGYNEFTLINYGKSYTYRVNNNAQLIKSYYPQENLNLSREEQLNVYAVCLRGSDVYAVINGEAVKMTVNEEMTVEGITDAYCVYSCTLSFNEQSLFKFNLGRLSISCMKASQKESIDCGNITLLKSDSSTVLNYLYSLIYSKFEKSLQQASNLSANPLNSVLSPFSDNGLGTAAMCRIYYEQTEQLGEFNAYDTYNPDLSALLKGTLDYISAITLTEDGNLRYELKSGKAVYAENCEFINNAYVMPQNEISILSVNDTAESKTDIIIGTKWMAPINVKTQQQSYTKGYLSFSYNTASFSAEYIDIDFDYTSDISNHELLTFSAQSPVSHAEILSSGSEKITLRLFLREKGRFFGYNLSQNENGDIVLSLKKRSNASLAGKVIMLDPGHGGLSMTGTALQNQSVSEADVTLAIAMKAKSMLEANGAVVHITRTMDTSLTLYERRLQCKEVNPDIFVSIHCDGSDIVSESGTHTFYYKPYSQPLAAAIHNSLVNNYRQYIYTEADVNYQKIDKKIKYYPFYVTRVENCPSVLVETGFMSNYVEGLLLADDNCQYWIADGITNGIINYFGNMY